MSIAIGDTISGGASAGSLLFVGAGPLLAQDNANLFWDDTNKRLGIGTNSPLNGVTVSKSSTGAVRVDALNTNTSSTANAFLTVSVAGAGAGDPVTIYDVSGVTNWATGIDNSDADKFKIASSAFLGTDDRLVITTDGKVGVNLTNPAARLHIQSGTTSLPAFKLTPGAKLTSPQAGDVEFDGTQFWITQTGGQRRSLIPAVADVMDFGAVGDGSTDDSTAVQAAVDAIAATGGMVFFPPSGDYVVGGVTITSKYPVHLVSAMDGHQIGGTIASQVGSDKARIQPKSGATFIFKWLKHADLLDGFGAGGGMQSLCIDDSGGGSGTARTVSLDSAVDIDDANIWKARNCVFSWLKGRAVKFNSTTYGQLLDCKFLGCGDAPRTGRLGITGTLTARTDNDTGEITFSTNHGIIPGDRLDIYWTINFVSYGRRGMIAGAVSGNVVPIDGGTGDALPAVSTAGITEAIRERAGTLTTRTDDNTGQVTLGTGHGIVTGDIIDVLWTISNVPYGRRGVVVGTVSGNILPIDGGLGDALPAASTAVTVTPPLLPAIGIGETEHYVASNSNFCLAWLRNLFIENTFWANAIKVSDVGGGALNVSNGYFENGYSDDVDNTFIDAGFGGLAVDSCSFIALDGDHEAITASSDYATIHNSTFENGNRTVPNILMRGQQCRLSSLRITGGGGTKSITISGLLCALSDIYLYSNGTLDVSASLFSQLSNIYVLTSSVPSGAYAIDLGDYNSLDHAVLRGPGFSSRAAGGGIRAGFSKISDASIYYFNETGVKTTLAGSQVLGCKVAEVTTLFDLATGTINSDNYPWADGLVYSNSAASSPISNTTVETDFDKTYAIDANRLRAGSVIRIKAQAVVTGTLGGGTLNLRLKLNNTVIQATSPLAIGSFVGFFDSMLIIRSIGASGTFVGTTVWALGTPNAVNPGINYIGVTAIDTTLTQTVKASAQFSNSGNSVRLDIIAVEILNGPTVG